MRTSPSWSSILANFTRYHLPSAPQYPRVSSRGVGGAPWTSEGSPPLQTKSTLDLLLPNLFPVSLRDESTPVFSSAPVLFSCDSRGPEWGKSGRGSPPRPTPASGGTTRPGPWVVPTSSSEPGGSTVSHPRTVSPLYGRRDGSWSVGDGDGVAAVAVVHRN